MYRAIVADDEELIRNGISDSIESMGLGIKVVAKASDGLETLEIYEKYIPDILLIDINIPHINGLECIKRIREKNCTSVIIIISGYDKFEYARRAIEHDVDFYLLKPVDDDEFYEVIKQAIDKFNHRLEEQNIISKFYPEKPKSKSSIIEFINTNYTNKDLSLEYMEKQFNICRSALYKLIKSSTEKSFIEYLTMLRINHAIRLMESDKEMTIREIALASGYTDQYYFSRVFKKNTGFSPKEYKDLLERNVKDE